MFTIGESRAISHANDTEHQAQQVAANLRGEDFPPKHPGLIFQRIARMKLLLTLSSSDHPEVKIVN